MLRAVSLAIVTVVAVLVPSAAQAEVDDARLRSVDAHLESYADANHVPGLAAAVVDPSGIVHAYVHGDDGDGQPVTRRTPFLIGSIAKTLTATVVMQLVDSGDLRLTDRASDILPWLGGRGPTVRQLLTHTGGYSTGDGLSVADRHDNTPGALVRAAKDLRRTGTPGHFEYSAGSYLVLGAIVEEVTGRSYARALRTGVLQPLDMSGSATTADEAKGLAPGHRLWFGRPRAYDAGFDESGVSFGYVASTLDDLAKFARAQLTGGAELDAATRQTMQSPQVETGEQRSYGYGWRIEQHRGQRLVHHTGATPGHFAHVLLVPGEDLAVVLLANSYSEASAPALASGAKDVAAIVQGRAPSPDGGDPVVAAVPWVSAALALAGVLVAALAFRRPVRHVPRVLVAVACVLVSLALWQAPGVLGYDLRLLLTWLPDAAWSLLVGIAAWLAAAAILVSRLVRDRGRSPGRP